MNKIVKAVKEGQEIETKNLFNVVNDFYLTRLRVSKDGESVVSMQVNVCEEHAEEYEFLQSCTMFDDVAYRLRKADIDSVTSEYNAKVDTLYVTCELKNGLTVLLMIINITGSENDVKDYREMDVYELKDFLEDVINKKNGYYCMVTRITDVFGFDLKMHNSVRTYINTLDEDDRKLHISDDFTKFEVPITDDSINEIYVKDNEQSESKSIVIKPFNQPFMEIDMLFLKRHD